jgi:NADH-quinone oxidoreductase subunit L
VALIGATTAVLAGVIAMTQTDLKRVLAYSTVSQLGYMFLALGAGTAAGIIAGMFHLFTHAFFKALLFLGAGSVMHAMGGVIDMRRFGGLRRLLPTTHWTFLVGCLALAGVFPLAGFFSKDAVLAAVLEQAPAWPAYRVLFWIALGAAGMTALYTFRAYFLTFFGRETVPAEAGNHAHESPPAMTGPLIVLAFCAVLVGVYFERTHGFADFLSHAPPLVAVASRATEPHGQAGHDVHGFVAAASSLAAAVGIALAAFFYLGSRRQVEWLAGALRPLYWLSYRKLLLDEIYYALVVLPLWLFSLVCYWLDRWLVDGLVNFVGNVPAAFGSVARALQGGLLQFYSLAMVLGLLVLAGALLFWSG